MLPPFDKIVIADTSCLILLSSIGEIELLNKIFKKVIITKTISEEFIKPLPLWIEVLSPANFQFQKLLELEVDKGEASAFALYFEIENAILALDDLKARKIAARLQLNFTGSLGIIVIAKQMALISSVLPLIEKIRKTKFRFSEEVINEILNTVGEKE